MFDETQESCERLAENLREAIAAGKSQEQAYYALDLRISEFPQFDDDCLAVIARALDDDSVQRSGNSARLILIITYNRDLLSETQTRDIMQSLTGAYPKFEDPAALILILEALIDSKTDEDATRLLDDLSRASTGAAAAMVPTGYIYLAERSTDIKTVERLRKTVAALSKRGGDLKAEAKQALRRLDARINTLRKAN